MLTARQTQILEFVKDHIRGKGFPPTRSEIQLHFGYHSVNAAEDHLRALQRHGAIQLIRGASRGIRLLEDKQKPALPDDSKWDEICRDAERYRFVRMLGAVDPEEYDRWVDQRRGGQHEEAAAPDSAPPLPG